ncbi:TonB-dependent siderophore receptor [Thauera linaloolentis]|uniref:TonB-dependent siderophore receptor n=1 Tax=Thauera linaloolentis (strain DSM 12138 / JCM 21573 / CCUG 41526 / CIP 105981 / IAM 15112 / NBRC 102519 / 47Lol) TaxID=1123367 RepID=N6XXU6_THAL4|nr:TonB-dependent siderophore receptor [Thauera linaloolentis]ENO86636.1 TonB-dependent siderophore receptor [Thauera linaloolentis 47Lol = DSM 12138]MCM8564505.1 TonB-dependent siderophore receptor [Thauera linaloolentis]
MAHSRKTPRRPGATRRRALLAAALLSSGIVLAQGTALNLDIPAQPLDKALNALARQSGAQIVFVTDVAAGLRAPALHGPLTVEQALQRLLAGSGLTVQANGTNTFTVIRDREGGTALAPVTVTAAADRSGTTEGTGSYTQTGPSGAATGLGLSLRETPQSLTVMTRQRMDDFRLETLTDVMEQTPGITVVRQGSHIGYQARGTNVNLQTEGNQQLTSGYSYFTSTHFTLDSMVDVDRIEVLKGSNGLLVGKGNTGATINLVRKRPTREFRARVGASAGSWDNYSANADIGGPLNEAGTVRGRVAAAVSDGESFRDYEKNESRTLFGTVEYDLTPDTVLAAGLTYRERDVRGLAMWTNITAYSVNDPMQFLGWQSRSHNPGASWSGYEQESTNIFARLEHRFTNGWTSKVQLAHESIEIPELLLGDSGDDFDTATRYLNTENRNSSIIADLKGPVQLFGRTHDVLLGAGASKANSEFDSNRFGYSQHEQEQAYIYAAGNFSLADPLKLLTGIRLTRYKSSNETLYDSSGYNESGVLTPYAGLVFDVSKNISLYGSYASIFQPQSNQDEQGRTLDPREGLSYEIGAKGEFFDKRLNASISHFWIRTDNEPEATGARTPSGGTAYRAVMGASRRGYELELSGELARNWQVQGGYTMNSSNLSNAGSNPKHQFKLGSTYSFSGSNILRGLTVGAATRWQSRTTAFASDGWYGSNVVEQPSYWVLDLMARYQINDQLSISANINNAFDKKYYAYVVDGYEGLGYTWGAPRSFNVSARYDF